ncbi:MAG TPA: hypothetical protein VNO55_04625 [Polyangia bacterium]|nr:hypothetical protein [Polyangia bacterium]
MAEPEYLQKETFEVWASNFDGRLKEALQLREQVQDTASDVAVLKDRSETSRKIAFSSLAGSAISFLLNLLWHR